MGDNLSGTFALNAFSREQKPGVILTSSSSASPFYVRVGCRLHTFGSRLAHRTINPFRPKSAIERVNMRSPAWLLLCVCTSQRGPRRTSAPARSGWRRRWPNKFHLTSLAWLTDGNHFGRKCGLAKYLPYKHQSRFRKWDPGFSGCSAVENQSKRVSLERGVGN